MKVQPLQNGTRVRDGHNTYGTIKVLAGLADTLMGTEVFTADVDIKDAMGKVIQKAGDRWLKVEFLNGIPASGWVAITHMGESICTEVQESAVEPDPWIKLTYPNGQEFFYDLRAGS